MPNEISEILTRIPLHSESASAIQKTVEKGDVAGFHAAFEKSLAKVRKRIDKSAATTQLISATGWHSPVSDTTFEEQWCRLFQLTGSEKLKPLSKKQLRALATHLATTFELSAAARIRAVVLSVEMLIRHTDRFEPEDLVQLIHRLLQLDTNALYDEVGEVCGEEERALWEQVLLAELPFALSLLLAPFVSTAQQCNRTTSRIAQHLEDASDSDGTPHASIARQISGWLGSFTRVVMWSKAFRKSWGEEPDTARWKAFVKRSVSLLTPKGFITQPSRARRSSVIDELSEATARNAVNAAGFSQSSATTRYVQSISVWKGAGRSKAGKTSKTENKVVTTLSDYSDWSATALLRNQLTADADVMAIDWDQLEHHLYGSIGGIPIFSGPWTTSLVVNGREMTSSPDWVCTCWFQDDEVAFVELESESGNGIRHVRHVMFALYDQFALINETVTGPDADTKLQVESRVSTVKEATCETNAITRDIWLKKKPLSLRAVPVWLPDDRLVKPSGSCGWKNDQLIMMAEGQGGLSLPLLLDWNADRKHRDADWSCLTVTERREVVTTHVACAYRARIGTLQMLIYRSLRSGDSLRAVLGLHTPSETVYGRVRNSGAIAPIVLVESDV